MDISFSKQRIHWPVVVLLLVALGVALLLRTASFGNFINPEGGFFFYSVDAYDHLRRITLGVHSFPSVPAFDFYAGFPRGTGQIWSPLFDYVLSAISLLFGGTKEAIETVSFFSNPFFATLTVLLIYIVAKKAFSSNAAGVVAAFLIAGNPGHISYSIPMNFDHHVLEPLIVLLLFGLPFFEKNKRLPVRGRIFVAFFLVLAIFMWRGSTVYWAMTFAAVLIRSFVLGNRKLPLDYAVGFISASVILALTCLADPWKGASTVSFGSISWFHVIVLLLFACILLLFALSRTRRSFLYAMAVFAGVVVLSFFFPQVRDFVSGIPSGISFLRGAGDPWLESNSELHGIFTKYNIFYSASYLTAAWFAAPLGAALALKNWKKNGMTDRFLITLAVWSPLVLLGLIRRYTPVAAVLSSLLSAYLIACIWQLQGGSVKRKAIVATGALILLVLPSLQHYKITITGGLPAEIKSGLYGKNGALQWLKDNTPATSHYLRPLKQPEYGVLANWDLGAKIYYLAERPAMATAFGWETHGFYEQAVFFSTERPDVAYAIIEDNHIRYVLLRAFEKLKMAHSIALDGEVKGRLPRGMTGNFNPQLSVYNRLMHGDGSGLRDSNAALIPSLGNYRLVFETDYCFNKRELQYPVSYYKIFQSVRGALLRGKGKPGTAVSLSLPLVTSRKRVFLFQDMALTDKDGNFAFRVPYASDGKQGDTIPLELYSLTGDGIRPIKVAVSESDVLEGRTVLLP